MAKKKEVYVYVRIARSIRAREKLDELTARYSAGIRVYLGSAVFEQEGKRGEVPTEYTIVVPGENYSSFVGDLQTTPMSGYIEHFELILR